MGERDARSFAITGENSDQLLISQKGTTIHIDYKKIAKF